MDSWAYSPQDVHTVACGVYPKIELWCVSQNRTEDLIQEEACLGYGIATGGQGRRAVEGRWHRNDQTE